MHLTQESVTVIAVLSTTDNYSTVAQEAEFYSGPSQDDKKIPNQSSRPFGSVHRIVQLCNCSIAKPIWPEHLLGGAGLLESISAQEMTHV
jgi:hypothetical protein